MLDRTESNGRMQIDIKPYHAAQHNSFGIELTNARSLLYRHLSDAWGELILNARELEGVFASTDARVKQSDGRG
jgi:hypothetical protein